MFESRVQAGKELAKLLIKYKNDARAVVLALPRGGVVLGAEVSKQLNLPLDVVMVRKIGHKGYSEYAIGAIAEDQPATYNPRELVLADKKWLKQAEAEARGLIKKRVELYFGNKKNRTNIKEKTAIIVDDGIATGFTMEAAIKAVKKKGARKIIVAVPVAPADTVQKLKKLVDEFIVIDNPDNFLGAVGSHYYRFEQTSDEEVKELLRT